jgi:hypothetical protein
MCASSVQDMNGEGGICVLILKRGVHVVVELVQYIVQTILMQLYKSWIGSCLSGSSIACRFC